jgi:hypothetical protein
LTLCTEILPKDKEKIIGQELQCAKNEKVCMVDDGINGAPALKTAYVSLAMGGSGNGFHGVGDRRLGTQRPSLACGLELDAVTWFQVSTRAEFLEYFAHYGYTS